MQGITQNKAILNTAQKYSACRQGHRFERNLQTMIYRTLAGYFRPYTAAVLLTFGLAAVNQVFALLDPYILQKIIDRIAVAAKEGRLQSWTNQDFVEASGLLILAALGVAMVSRIAKNLQDYMVNRITQQVGAKMYSDGLRHALSLPYEDFEDARSGQTLGILQRARADVEKLVSAVIDVLFTSLVGIVFVMIYAFNVYWVIAPVYFLSIPLLGLLSSFLSRKIKAVQSRIVTQTTDLAGATTESLRNIELIKSLGLIEQEDQRLRGVTRRILGLELTKIKYMRSLSFVQGTFVNLMRNLIVLMMLYLIFKDKISLGQFFSLFMYSFYIFNPLQEWGNMLQIFRETEISLGRFRDLMSRAPEPQPAHAKHINIIKSVQFEEVTYRHRSAGHPAVENLNLHLEQGRTYAFVGPSGSGKTTLIKLLLGLYQPRSGNIRVNGIPFTEINLNDLRLATGLVAQDTQLFAGTIGDNLRFVAPQAEDSDCLEAMRQASCIALLERAPMGLETTIGEGGVKLSGGEKQRLSIARALLRRPSLLVFDEATSSLDSLTEDGIARTLQELSAWRKHTVILVAHRLSTVLHADCIHVMEKGHIVESGTHRELVNARGLYYAMWRQQIGERRESQFAESV
jgi:ATP-binding cassette subfamily B protein